MNESEKDELLDEAFYIIKNTPQNPVNEKLRERTKDWLDEYCSEKGVTIFQIKQK